MRRWWTRKGMGVELPSGNFCETARVGQGVHPERSIWTRGRFEG